MAIENKLNKLKETKQNIKSAIEEKGQTVGDIPFAQYAEKISEIEGEPKLGVIYRRNESNPEFLDATVFIDRDKVPDFFLTGVNEHLADSFSKNKLSSINMSKPLTKVGVKSFANNAFITEIGNMGILTEIGVGAFHGCESLISVELHEDLEIIEDYAFAYCSSLKLNELPSGIKRIGEMSFYNSNISLESLPDGLQEIDSSGLQETNINVENFPLTLKKLGNSALAKCLQSTNINLPGISTIANYAFENSPNLITATLGSQGNPVTSISRSIFESCGKLSNINIYVSDPKKPGLPGAPWGATNATITYLQA